VQVVHLFVVVDAAGPSAVRCVERVLGEPLGVERRREVVVVVVAAACGSSCRDAVSALPSQKR